MLVGLEQHVYFGLHFLNQLDSFANQLLVLIGESLDAGELLINLTLELRNLFKCSVEALLGIDQAFSHIILQDFLLGHFLGLLSCQGLDEFQVAGLLLKILGLLHVLLGLEASLFSGMHLTGLVFEIETHRFLNFLRFKL